MDQINILIEHLLTTKHSIDRLESISNRFNIDNQRLVTLIRQQRYQLYFQLLRPDTHRKHQGAKIALTLDVNNHFTEIDPTSFFFCSALLLYPLCSTMQEFVVSILAFVSV